MSFKSTLLPGHFASIKNSFYNPEFYKKIPSFPFKKILAYLLLVVTLSYLFMIGKEAIFLYQNREKIQDGIEKIYTSYPAELELTFDKGTLTTNVQEPYFLPAEPFNTDYKVQGTSPEYFAVIDTTTPFSQKQLEAYGAIVWLSGDTAYVQSSKETKLIPYPTDSSTVVNKDNFTTFVDEIWEKIQNPLLVIGLVLLVVCNFGLFLAYVTYLVMASLLYFFFSQVAGKKREYPQCYRLAAYALTPALLLQALIQAISLITPLQMPPFLFTAVLLLTVYFNVREPAKLKP